MSLSTEVEQWVLDNWAPDVTLGEWWARLFDAGLAYPTWPEGLGGRGATVAEAREVSAVLAAAGVIVAPAGNGPNMGAPTMFAHATAEQQQRLVGPLGAGQTQWCQLFSEPGAGSDLASVSTRAIDDGDDYVITGQKVWSSKADVSEWGMLLCRTDFDAPKHGGITYLMIDMTQAEVEVRTLVQMNGASEFSEVFLNEARVPKANVIGVVGGGWSVARTTLAHERASVGGRPARGAVVVEAGSIAGNLDRPVGDLVERFRAAGGAPRRQATLLSSKKVAELAATADLAGREALRDRVVRYHVDSLVHRWNTQRLRDLAKARVPTALDGSVVKLQLAKLAHQSRDLSLDLLGPAGMLSGASAPDGGRVAHTALSAFVPSLGGGTNEIQKNIVAERTLGLPRDLGEDPTLPFRATRRS